jgi:RimJ/RimL family protein N-acetyltransferase
MKKLGFVYEGTMREAELKKGKRVSLEVYSLLKREF